MGIKASCHPLPADKGPPLKAFMPGRSGRMEVFYVYKKLAFFLARVMAAASLSLPAFAYDNLFSDVPEDAWEAPYVYDLVDRGILSGYGDGTFGPRITVKRCEYAKMLVSITNTPISTSVSSPYVDVPSWEWYFPW